MEIYKLLSVLIALMLLLVPLLALETDGSEQAETGKETMAQAQAPQTVKLYLTETQETVAVELEEYLLGVLAAEMPVGYHEEALKAQAVVAYTYLMNKKSTPDSALGGADLSDSSATHQGYLNSEGRREKWGDKCDSYEEKLKRIIVETESKLITYDGEPIVAAFHAINSGKTQSAQTVWGGDVPYLKSVNSIGDKLSPDCTKTVAISSGEFADRVAGVDGCSLNGAADGWIESAETSSDGYVQSIVIGSAELSGLQAREALGLRSAVFTYEYKDDNFLFTTNGYGHCVGMSQYGADYMARQGSTWEEIIKHYYSGIEIEG